MSYREKKQEFNLMHYLATRCHNEFKKSVLLITPPIKYPLKWLPLGMKRTQSQLTFR